MLTLAGLRQYNRYQAALGHFGLSLIIFAILGYLVYFCWYPQPLFSIDAGWQGMRILAFVDFVLGPCITLVIFNPKKKELFKDLAIIALIQVSALSYGTYHVYQSRPAIVVYADNQFRTAAYGELHFFKLPKTITNEISFFRPSFFFLDIPRTDIIDLRETTLTNENVERTITKYDKQRQPILEATAKKIPYFLLPDRLRPYKSNLDQIRKYTITINTLRHLPKDKKILANSFIRSNSSELAISSVKGRYGYALVSLNDQGEFNNFLPGNYAKTWLSNNTK